MKVQRLLNIVFLSLSAFLVNIHLVSAALDDDIKGTLLVVSKTDNSVSFIDIASGDTHKTLPTGQGPHELVISRDGLWAVVSDFVGGNSLTVIDIANQSVARTIDLKQYPRPHGIQFLADPALIAATSGAANSLVIADIHKGEVVNVINTTQQGTHMVAVRPEDNIAYTTNMRSGTIAMLDVATNSFVKTFRTEQTPEAIRLSPSGNEIWYGANKKGLVKVIDLATGKDTAKFSDFSFPYRVLFTTDGVLAFVPDYRKNDIRFFDAMEKKELGKLTLDDDAGPQGVILHPNNQILFLSLNTRSEVVAIDVHKREVIQTYKSGTNPDGIGYTHLTF